MTPPDYDSMLARFAEEPSLTADLVLTRLRERNASMVEAIKALVQLFGLSLGESKKLASHHDAWRAVHAANLPLHEEAKLVASDRSDAHPRRAANRA
jgi:ribosomal protein L7/L12